MAARLSFGLQLYSGRQRSTYSQSYHHFVICFEPAAHRQTFWHCLSLIVGPASVPAGRDAGPTDHFKLRQYQTLAQFSGLAGMWEFDKPAILA